MFTKTGKMVPAFVVGLLVSLTTGCASMGFTSDTDKLFKQVSFDHDCPVEQISLVKSMEGGIGQASFVVNACGTERRYERMGTGYFEKGNEPEAVKQLQGGA